MLTEASHRPKKGALRWKNQTRKWMVVVDGKGVPLAYHLDSASPAEVTLIETTLDKVRVPRTTRGRPRKKVTRLIYDKAADSDELRDRLKKNGVDLICPHRSHRKRKSKQDGRKLRRYRKRWKVERTFSWIGNYKRLVVRYDRHIHMYRAFFSVACIMTTLGKL